MFFLLSIIEKIYFRMIVSCN